MEAVYWGGVYVFTLSTYQSQNVGKNQPKLDAEDNKCIQHLCGVLLPFRVATKVMEKSRTMARAGAYLPMRLDIWRTPRRHGTPQ